MEHRIKVGMGFHANFGVLRKLLRAGYRTKTRTRKGVRKEYKASYYKAGVYIISHSYDQPKFKIGMASNSYQRLRNGYNLCFSEHKSFRVHYFVEVPGPEKKRREFEEIALSRFRVDDQKQTILNDFQSREWILKENKDQLLRNLVEVLNNSLVWSNIYSFSEQGYKCVPRSDDPVTEDDLKPSIKERTKCDDDVARAKRNKENEQAETKRENEELRAAEAERKATIRAAYAKYKNAQAIRRRQNQFGDPLARAIRESTNTHRRTLNARAERLARRLRRRGD